MEQDKLHDLTMYYLNQYKPKPGSPADLVDEYYRIRKEIQDEVVAYQKKTGIMN